MGDTKTLLPCPFCGGDLEIAKHFSGPMWRGIHRCKVVGAITFDWRDSHEGVAAEWNTRAPLASHEARIAELEGALKAEANADMAQANYERLCTGLSEADEATIEDAGVFALELRQTAKELRARVLHTEATEKVPAPFVLRPMHRELLRRGVNNKWIWLSDDAGRHTAEIVALGELQRAGFVEEDPGPFPPGPPSMPPKRITDAGRALHTEGE